MTSGDCYSSNDVTIRPGGQVFVMDKNGASDLQKEEIIEDAISYEWVPLRALHDPKIAREA
jgi:hypothetical protein